MRQVKDMSGSENEQRDTGADVDRGPSSLEKLISSADNLTVDSSLDEVGIALEGFLEKLKVREVPDRVVAVARDKMVNCLKEIEAVQSPARLVDTYLKDLAKRKNNDVSASPEEHVSSPEELLELGREILECQDQLARLRKEVRKQGFAGETKAVELLYLAFASRVLQRPINVAVEGPSSAGKSYAVEVATRFHPPELIHELAASSEKALVYSDFRTEHAHVYVKEASGLHRDGIGATIIRELASANRFRYETVEKGPDGELSARIIEKPGPTGLVTTTTKTLDPEVATRMLHVQVPDSPEQTEAVLECLAREAAEGRPTEPRFDAWLAASRWLQAAGNRRVVVPFAPELARKIPTKDVRMRRDFKQILTLVKVHALVHQRNRSTDSEGRIVAEARDYHAAYRLLKDVMAVTLDGVSDETREAVEAVAKLTRSNPGGVSCGELARELGLTKGGASRRAKKARKGGYLANKEERRGYPARFVPADPLPEDRTVLPRPSDLSFQNIPGESTQRLNAPRKEPEDTAPSSVERGVAPEEASSQHRSTLNTSRNGESPRTDGEAQRSVEPLSRNERGRDAPEPVTDDRSEGIGASDERKDVIEEIFGAAGPGEGPLVEGRV